MRPSVVVRGDHVVGRAHGHARAVHAHVHAGHVGHGAVAHGQAGRREVRVLGLGRALLLLQRAQPVFVVLELVVRVAADGLAVLLLLVRAPVSVRQRISL